MVETVLANPSSRSARDVEPLVNAWVNGCWCLLLVCWDVEALGVNTVRTVCDRDVGAKRCQSGVLIKIHVQLTD